MKMSKLTIAVALCAMVVFSTACDSLLDTEPQQSVSPDIALGTPEGVRSVYNSTYNRLTHYNYYGRNLSVTGDVLADNAEQHPNSSGYLMSEVINSMGTGVGGWNRYYQINEINLILKYAPEVEGLPEDERLRTMGEMYFLRGLAYHDLAKAYAYEPNQVVDGFDQGVILRTEPSETLEDTEFQPRASVTEIYNQIESDLLNAIDYLEQSDGRSAFYGNKAAAEALLARVYLYWEKYDEAETYATRAMNTAEANGIHLAEPGDVASMYADASSPTAESLFELRYTQSEGQGVNNSTQAIFTPAGHYDILPSQEFLALLEEDDVRNGLYPLDTDVYPDEGDGYRFLRKYDSSVGTFTDNFPIIRYSEALLTRAEARAHQGNNTGAIEDLNTMREARGIEAISPSSGQVVNEILEERRRELAFEGHRWQDLKRRGMDVVKPAATQQPVLRYGVAQTLSRIPTSEVDLNPELTQNPGY